MIDGSTTITVAEYRALASAPKRHKYGIANVVDRTTPDGIVHHSAAEARRWVHLCYRLGAGEISQLCRQVRYPLVVNGQRVAWYVADFTYLDDHGRPVVEDVKGVKTPLYALKKRLMLACWGITLVEVQV